MALWQVLLATLVNAYLCACSLAELNLSSLQFSPDGALSLLQARASLVEQVQVKTSHVPYLSHSSGSVTFLQRTLAEGCTAWTDRNGTYVDVPAELVGSTLFATKRRGMPPGNLTLSSVLAGYAYIWGTRSSRKRNPDLTKKDGWEDVGVMHDGKNKKFRIFRHVLSARTPIYITLRNLWVGGIAYKMVKLSASLIDTTSAVKPATLKSADVVAMIDTKAHQIVHTAFLQLSLNRNTAAFLMAVTMLLGMAISFRIGVSHDDGSKSVRI